MKTTTIIILLLYPILSVGQILPIVNDSNSIFNSLDSLEMKILDNEKNNRAHQHVDSMLINGSGKIIEYGIPLFGYTYNVADTSKFGKVTAIVEFKNNKINGRRIQFFNYPYDTASVEFFKNDTLDGPFFYNHLNGKLWLKGIYKKGELFGQKEYWTENGEKITNNIVFDEKTQLYYSDNRVCNNKKTIYELTSGKVRCDIYFNNGKMDSLYTYNWAYWGKSMEIRRNYSDSTRKYINYGSTGKIKWIYSQKILSINLNKLYKEGDELFISDKDSLIQDGKFTTYFDNTDIISEEGFYKNGVKVGKWKYYDKTGKLINIIEN